ncbi:hypothetical protein [Kitasatospora azatica]|uniref:hypothetical protein n=1 Tax=Kitasatospora azatica TaxID=58347 RepID=UPI00055ADDC4|nr:hypothetical protein [Kitasatospora azatica]
MPATSGPGAQLIGSYLKTLLPRRSSLAMLGLGPTLPSGWVANDVHERDSGPAVAATAAPSVVGAGTCSYLTGEDLDLAGGLSVASATEPLNFGNAHAALTLHAYGPGDAAKSLAEVRQSVTSACAWFTALYPAGAVTVNVSATPVSGLGDEALLVSTAPQGPYLGQEDLLVRRGDLMLSLNADNSTGSLPDLSPVAAALVPGMG